MNHWLETNAVSVWCLSNQTFSESVDKYKYCCDTSVSGRSCQCWMVGWRRSLTPWARTCCLATRGGWWWRPSGILKMRSRGNIWNVSQVYVDIRDSLRRRNTEQYWILHNTITCEDILDRIDKYSDSVLIVWYCRHELYIGRSSASCEIKWRHFNTSLAYKMA